MIATPGFFILVPVEEKERTTFHQLIKHQGTTISDPEYINKPLLGITWMSLALLLATTYLQIGKQSNLSELEKRLPKEDIKNVVLNLAKYDSWAGRLNSQPPSINATGW